MSPNGDLWISSKPGFFLPVKILSRVFPGKLLSKFEAASWPLVEAFGASRFYEETERASAVFANEREAEVLTGRLGVQAAATLGARYRLAAVKMDRRGAVVCVDGAVTTAPAEQVHEVDPTGAGDAFDGVLLAMLALGAAPVEALARACHAGSLVAGSRQAWPEPGASRG